MSKKITPDVPVIAKTTDYSIFAIVKGNRPRNKNHIQRLMNSIRTDANCIRYTPILVNERGEIIDGQHRFEALKKLDLPVYYIEQAGLTLAHAQTLNSMTKPWSPLDYARSFSERGNLNYTRYIELKDEFGFNHDVLMKYLSLSNPITTTMYKEGRLIVEDIETTRDLSKKLMDFALYYPRFRTRSFALAFKTLYESEGYDHKRMLANLEAREKSPKIADHALPIEFLAELREIYEGN